jgi:ABC-type antimicrobial peptide transport system permease subunit
MKSYLSLAWKELKAQKVNSVLILIAIVLSTVMTTVVGQSIGILQAMRINQAASLNGDRYVTFHQLSQEQAQSLSEDNRLIDVGSLINIGYADLKNSGLTLYIREYCGDALDAYPAISEVKEGRLPEKEYEIALPENVLQYLEFEGEVGDTISIPLEVSLRNDTEAAYQYDADFTLCGILKNSYLGYSSGIVDGIVGEGTAKSLLPERYFLYSTDFKTYSTEQFQSIVNELAEELTVDEANIQYNSVLLETLGIAYAEAGTADTESSGFSFMTVACVMVGVLVLLAAGLVIYNILKIAVSKRVREYGTIRAIGGEKKQLYCLVMVQLLLLCGIGIPLGVVLGLVSSQGILTAAMSFLNPDLFMASTTQELTATINASSGSKALPLVASVAITLIFAGIAAFPAARYASCVSPTVAMSGVSGKVKRRNRKAKKIRNFEAFYARLNLKRNRGRTIITILSMVMSITVFVALQSFSGLMDASTALRDSHLGDYSITNETIGITASSVEELRENEMIDTLSTTMLTVYQHDETGAIPIDTDISLQTWEALHIVGFDNERLTTALSSLSENDKADLINGTACLVKNPIPVSVAGQDVENTELSVNDEIQVGDQTLRVAGIVDEPATINNEGFVNGVQIIVCDDTYTAITGQNQYAEVYPTLTAETETEYFETWLDEWCSWSTGSHWLSYRQSDAELSESFAQINMLCWGLILFIGLIGVLNIINTVYTNILTRVSEIGMQRAIGISKASLYKTFFWEGAYYGLIASVVGGLLGYICSVFIEAAANNTLQFDTVPIIAILEAAVISVVACLAATAVPLRSIAKADIVKSIITIE